jgi:signal transduction histidine kinase
LQVNLRRLVVLMLLTVILPTALLTGVGIAVIVVREEALDLVFGLLVVIFAGSVSAGASLMMIVASRGARLARTQETFLSRMGHELLTPLAGIRLHTDILIGLRLPPDAEASVAAIRKESARLEGLVERTLSWRRMRSPEHLYDRAETSADRVAELALDRSLHESSIRLSLRDGALPLVADEGALAEALADLLQNAVKYAGAGGSIELIVRRWTRWAVFVVRDRGPGLPEDRIERVFLPFFRRAPDGDPDPGGSGLGLTIARQIAIAHGGRLTASNRAGGGARFTLVIPLRAR